MKRCKHVPVYYSDGVFCNFCQKELSVIEISEMIAKEDKALLKRLKENK